ncbi:MAG: hypothetical protein ACRCSS_19395 [Shewanella sp.]
MAVQVNNTISKVSWALNPVPVLISDNATQLRYFTYSVESQTVVSETFEAAPDANKEAKINIAPLLFGFFNREQYPLPALPTTSVEVNQNQTSVARPYTLNVTAKYTAPPHSNTSVQGWAVWGGVSDTAFDTDLILKGDFTALQPYTAKTTTPNSLEFITFINTGVASTPPVMVLEYQLFGIDGELLDQNDFALTPIQQGKTSLIDVSYSRITASATALVYSYAVRLHAVNGATAYWTPYYTFTVNHDYFPQETEMLYINPQGGLTSVVLRGAREDVLEIDRTDVNKARLPFHPAMSPRKTSYITRKEAKFTVSTGYYEEWNEDYERIIDLANAPAIWERQGTKLLPVMCALKKIVTRKSADVELVATEMEFTYSINTR